MMGNYALGWIFGATVIASALLHFPSLDRPLAQILTVLAFVAVGIFAGVEIVRKRRRGWWTFFVVVFFLIVLQTMTAWEAGDRRLAVFLLGYTLWVGLGFLYYLRAKPLLN